jgi:phosphopantothenoylcysteine decarboxylase/phosphopantothenate--cysteine ligase
MLTATALASKAPLLIAPAMNTGMWDHPATQQNMTTLTARGVRFVDAGTGDLACGLTGIGRMAEPQQIAEVICKLLDK